MAFESGIAIGYARTRSSRVQKIRDSKVWMNRETLKKLIFSNSMDREGLGMCMCCGYEKVYTPAHLKCDINFKMPMKSKCSKDNNIKRNKAF